MQVRAIQKGTDKKKIITKQIAIMNKLLKRMQINQKIVQKSLNRKFTF